MSYPSFQFDSSADSELIPAEMLSYSRVIDHPNVLHGSAEPELIPADMLSRSRAMWHRTVINTHADVLHQVVNFLKRHIAFDIDELWRRERDLPHVYDNDTVGEPIIYWLHDTAYADSKIRADVRAAMNAWLQKYGYKMSSLKSASKESYSNKKGWYMILDK